MTKVLIICGSTATGKTKLAVGLAKKFNGELIAADSRQVFIDLDALTGKDRKEIGNVPVWLYDIVDPKEEFSVAQFQELAKKAIADVESRNKLPIVVGGTGLYLKAITQPLPLIHVPRNEELREKFEHADIDTLQNELKKVNPEKWQQMNESDRYNPRRLIRAIEIADAQIPTEEEKNHYDALWIGLSAELPTLEKRIKERVADRWEESVCEVNDLRENTSGISSTIIGIPFIRQFLAGELSREEAKAHWSRKEFQYAKRQITWFKKQKNIHWFDRAKPFTEEAEHLIRTWYTKST